MCIYIYIFVYIRICIYIVRKFRRPLVILCTDPSAQQYQGPEAWQLSADQRTFEGWTVYVVVTWYNIWLVVWNILYFSIYWE